MLRLNSCVAKGTTAPSGRHFSLHERISLSEDDDTSYRIYPRAISQVLDQFPADQRHAFATLFGTAISAHITTTRKFESEQKRIAVDYAMLVRLLRLLGQEPAEETTILYGLRADPDELLNADNWENSMGRHVVSDIES